MAPSALPSKRCFLCDLATRTFVANSRETVRLLGVAVNLEAAVDEVVYPGHQNCWDNSSGVGPIGPSSSDYRNLMLLTLDDGTAVADIFIPDYMIQKLEVRPGHTLECIALLRQRGSTKKWYANSLSRVTDPHVEILRWMELCLPPSPDEVMKYGYPTIKPNANEALRLIRAQAKVCDEGASMQDLASVMQLSQEVMQELILQLQLSAQIYQNELGNYVPL